LKELGNLRADLKNAKKVQGLADVTVTEGRSSGKQVAKLTEVSKAFDGRTVIDAVSLRIGRGERIGVVGPNGSGKTTLLKLIMGDLEADSGKVELGLNLDPLVIDQNRETLNPDWTLADALTDGGGDSVIVADKPRNVIGYMKDFLFLPEQKRTPVHALSGGERGRLQLARGLRLPSNLLVLDEPTNDLDLETLDLLQEIVADYAGTVIVVSHDRDFLDRTVTRTLAYEGQGKWQIYAGGYSDMVAQRGVGVQARKSENAAKSKPKSSESHAAKKTSSNKLSYKHKFRLESLPAEMESVEAEIERLNKVLADPDLYSKDPDRFNAKSTALVAAQTSLAALEEEWLELEILRESAGG
jgi:ATP-binding cassette subfamily F protein uup